MEDKNENKIYSGDDGIVYVEFSRILNRENVFKIIEDISELLRKDTDKVKILINVLEPITVSTGSIFRKKVLDKVKEIYNSSGFEKAALCSISLTVRTAMFFVIKASKIKNVKIFETKEEAIKWLKEP